MMNKRTGTPFGLPRLTVAVAIASAWLAASSAGAADKPVAQRNFDTPQQAAEALVQAAGADDISALLAILGPDGKPIVSSGDPVRDKNDLAKFAERAHEKMEVSFDISDPTRATIIVGSGDWPMPVPLVQKNGKWRFNAKEGRREILARRIGGNELDAISLLRGYVEAQKDYAAVQHDGSGMNQYAQKWVSTAGKQDGLSWRNPDGSVGGPIGDEIAKALAAGYTKKGEPYNGYYFRTLNGQGPAARLGARNYIVNGMMIGGFAAIAWPASYGVTGVKTFVVNNDGVVYEKDLGPDTGKTAPTIKLFNPGKGWTITKDEEID
jgi:hypothetical protein